MDYTIYIFTALTGAAALGFLSAWTIQLLKMRENKENIEKLANESKEQEEAFNRLKAEYESQSLSVSNLQKLLEDVESQFLASSEQVKELKVENAQLKQSCQELQRHDNEIVREIEVIREVPVLVFRDRPAMEDKREKAKKLVKAFKKGYLHDREKTTPPGEMQ